MPINNFDILVIGGGAAGIMAAMKAREAGSKVAILEKNSSLGKKLLLTGGGRCNITNAIFDNKKLAQKYGKEGFFILPALSVFGVGKTIEFFGKNGVKTKTEKDNKVYCITNDANDVVEVFKKLLAQNNVSVFYNSDVKKIESNNKTISEVILQNGEKFFAKKYILATGGKSYCATGSTGDGYKWAEELGHKIEKLRPGLTPIKIKEDWVKKLQGLSLKNEKINIFYNRKKIFSETGDIIFAHFGLSGPAILNTSSKIGELLEKGEVKISLDLFSDLNQEEAETELQKLLLQNNRKQIANLLTDLFPQRLVEIILMLAGLSHDKKCGTISKKERQILSRQMKNMQVTVDGLFDFNSAIITTGGISLKEIDAKTMKSKIIKNLYFAGEIINLHGPTGGYNLQACWSTGYLSGQSAGQG